MQAILLAIGGFLCWRGQLTAWALLALSMFLLFDVCRTFEVAMFSGARRQRPAAFIAVLESLVRPLAIVAAVILFSARLDIVLLATAAGLALVTVFIYGGGRLGGERLEGAAAADTGDPGSTLAMRRFTRQLVPYAALMWITSVSDRYIIEWFSSDLASVGIYAAGYGLISQPFIMVNSVVSLTLRPVYFAQVSAQETLSARRTFRVWLLVETALCAVGVLLSLALRHWVVDVFLAPKYAQAAAVVPWIALGYFFYAVQQLLEQHLLAHKQVGSVLAGQATAAVASIAVTVPLVGQFGMIGAAYACPLYFAAACLVTSGMIYRHSRAAAPTAGPNATIPS
jgi:O-antigen/teichoic acid export membrane protein